MWLICRDNTDHCSCKTSKPRQNKDIYSKYQRTPSHEQYVRTSLRFFHTNVSQVHTFICKPDLQTHWAWTTSYKFLTRNVFIRAYVSGGQSKSPAKRSRTFPSKNPLLNPTRKKGSSTIQPSLHWNIQGKQKWDTRLMAQNRRLTVEDTGWRSTVFTGLTTILGLE